MVYVISVLSDFLVCGICFYNGLLTRNINSQQFNWFFMFLCTLGFIIMWVGCVIVLELNSVLLEMVVYFIGVSFVSLVVGICGG